MDSNKMGDILEPKPLKSEKQQQEELPILSLVMKVFLVLLGLLIYVYLLVSIKDMYLKMQEMDRVALMVVESEQMVQKLYALDRDVAINIERLDNMLEDLVNITSEL